MSLLFNMLSRLVIAFLKKQSCHFADKGLYSQSYCFSSSYVQMWEVDHKESWTLKNWCFWTTMLEKTLESPLVCKKIQLVNPKGNQSWIFTERSEAKAETPVLWPPYVKNQLIGKDPDAGKDWRQEEEDDRRWDGWMASPTLWTWVWVQSRSWWWTGKPGVFQSVASQRVREDWATELTDKFVIAFLPRSKHLLI